MMLAQRPGGNDVHGRSVHSVTTSPQLEHTTFDLVGLM